MGRKKKIKETKKEENVPEMTQQPKQKKLIQRLVRRDNIAKREEQGWKIVPTKPTRFRDQFADAILMERLV